METHGRRWNSVGRLIPTAQGAGQQHSFPEQVMAKLSDVESVIVDNITIPAGRRGLDEATVVELMASIQRIGLLTPITVRSIADDDLTLIAGRHRLEAAHRLGWESIPAVFLYGDDTDARMLEIAENLHRAELTVLERTRHIAEWIRLTEEKQTGVSAQPGPKLSRRGRSGEGRPKGGINAAVRELGVTRQEGQRAVAINAIVPEAKEAAIAAGLADNQSALLKVAAAPPADQPAKVEDLARHREKKRAGRTRAPAVAADDPIAQVVAILVEFIPTDRLPVLLSQMERTTTAAVVDALRRRPHGIA